MPTLNFSSSDDYIIPSNKSFTYRGLDGNDTYIISPNTISDNAKISIIDTSGSNIIQLTNGLTIDSNLFTKNAMRLYLENGAEITVSNADKFTYNVGGNATTGKTGSVKTFLELAELFGLNEVPSSGSKKGTTNLIIKNDSTSSSLEATDGDDNIKLTSSDDSFLVTTGNDTIDGGSGNDTVIIPSGSRIVPGNDETGSITEKSGKDFIWVQLEDSSTESGFSQQKTILTNFENIQISGENSITSIKNFVGTNNFTIKNLQLKDKTINNGDIKSYDMSPYFASNNYNYVRNYTISSDASNEIADQINLITTSLDTTPFIKLTFGGTDKEYRLYKDPLTWIEAKKYSEELSLKNDAYSKSHLVIINSKEEIDGLWNEIKTILNGMNAPKVSDGGNSSYLWLGASDSDEEGNWSWIDGANFGSLEENYWGSGDLGNEPDNYNNQDALALGIENWPSGSENNEGYGNAGFWNDIDSDNEIWYLVELDKTGISSNPILQLEGGKGGPTYDAIITITAKENLLDTSERFGEASITFKVTMSDDDYNPDKPIITNQTNDETSITVSEEILNMDLLDLAFLNADEGSLSLKYVQFSETLYSYGDEEKYARFEIESNTLKLQKDSYFDFETQKFYYRYTSDDGNSLITPHTLEKETFDLTLRYKVNGVSKDHVVKMTIADLEETTIVNNIEEDSPGIDLLDLTSFEIDKGTTPILLSYTYENNGELMGPYTYNDDKLNFFDIDSNSIKLAHKSYLDADNNKFFYEYTPDDGSPFISSYSAKDFTLKFSYISNGNIKNHELKIGSIKDNYYGHKYYGDNNYYTWENNSPSSNPIVNQLLEEGRFKKSHTDQELTIYYSFAPKTDIYDDDPIRDPNNYFEYSDPLDRLLEPTEMFKSMVKKALDYISSIVKITFVELSDEDYDQATLRFALFESDQETSAYGYADPPGFSEKYAQYIVFNYTVDKNSENYVTRRDYSLEDNNRDGSFMYQAIIHEIGHALGLKHPFELNNGNLGDETNISDSRNNNKLFTNQAYHASFNENTDTYNITFFSGENKGEQVSASGIFNISTNKSLAPYTLMHNDILTYEFLYGLRSNYNAEDTVYTFLPEIRFLETIHDMGGNDTIDLSNYSSKTKIDLNPKGINEIGEKKLYWQGDNYYIKSQQESPNERIIEDGAKSGDVFIIGPKTTIEIFVGSKGDNNITLDQNVIQTVTTFEGSDIIKNALVTDTISAGSGSDEVFVTINSLSEINSLINIDGGSGGSFFSNYTDTLHLKMDNISSVDLSIISSNFDNFETYDFLDSFEQEINIVEDDFISTLIKIEGDSVDKVLLPENASQTRTDESYIYYSMNDNEIAIADTMMIG